MGDFIWFLALSGAMLLTANYYTFSKNVHVVQRAEKKERKLRQQQENLALAKRFQVPAL